MYTVAFKKINAFNASIILLKQIIPTLLRHFEMNLQNYSELVLMAHYFSE